MLTSAGTGPVEGVERQIAKPIRRAELLQALAEALVDSAPDEGEAEPEPETASVHGRVLVVEDNPVNQLVIETLLRTVRADADTEADEPQDNTPPHEDTSKWQKSQPAASRARSS